MSLDISLITERYEEDCCCSTCGHIHKAQKRNEAFSDNYTHNVNTMAEEAGLYDVVWRPEENGITKAKQMIEPLKAGIALMKSDPERFEKFNPTNKWGSYNTFLPWLNRLLEACEEYPEAEVEVSR